MSARLLREVAIWVAVAALALLALWAFTSYCSPAFTGERAAALLRCN